MVEAGDTVSITLKKEFGEEAMNSMEATEEEKKEIEAHINTLFHNGEEVRSTAWFPYPVIIIADICWICGRPTQHGQCLDGNSRSQLP